MHRSQGEVNIVTLSFLPKLGTSMLKRNTEIQLDSWADGPISGYNGYSFNKH